MADGQVQIQVNLDNSNIRSQVAQTNQQLSRVGSNMGQTARQMNNAFGSGFAQMNNSIARGYTQVSQAHMGMMNEMKQAFYQQKAGMSGVVEKQIEAKYGYFKLAQAQGQYTGSTADLLSRINEIGKAQKKATDQEMNANKLRMMSIYQTIGYLNNASSTASRFQNNLTQMNNPLYNTSRLALTAVDNLDRLARSGSPQQLALEFLGANASVKQYNDFIRDLGTQMMAMPVIFGLATAGAIKFYGALHGKVMEENTKYAEAFNNMIEKLTKAFEPMRQAFASMMIPLYNFISKIAELVIVFNEAHPTIAKFIQGMMMLVPALMVILTPLALGIGYFKGLRAILFALRPIMMPIITGFAMMSAPAWILAGAITGLVMVFTHLWKTNEGFKNSIMSAIGVVAQFGKTMVALGKYLFWTAVDGDHLNDWITHLPEPFQATAEKVGASIVRMREAIVGTFPHITAFGQNIASLGKYLFWTAVDGDHLNDWITHLPEPFQATAEKVGASIVSIRGAIIGCFPAIQQFGQNIVALGKYLFFTALDGDHLNDWLTHLPASFQAPVEAIGLFVSNLRASIVSIFPVLTGFGENFMNLGRYLLEVATTGNIMNGFLSQLGGNFQVVAIFLGTAIEQMKASISSFVEAVKLALGGDTSALGQVFATILPTLIGLLLGGFPALLITAMRFLPTIVDGINSTSSVLSTTITNLITGAVNLITTYLPQFLNQGILILTKVIEGLVQVLPQVVTTIVECATTMINSFITIIGTLLPVILDAGIKILMAVIDGIVKSLPQIVNACVTVIDTLVQSLVRLLPQIIDAGIKILMALIDGIIKILPNLTQTAITLIMKIADTLLQNLPKILDAGMKILMALIDGIIKILPQLIQSAITIIMKIVETLMANMPKIWQAGMKILMELIKGIIQILPQLISTALKLIVQIASTLIQNLPKIWKAGMQILAELIKGILSLVGQLISTITGKVVNGILNCFKDAGNWLVNTGKNIIQGLINGISGMVGKAVSAVKKVGSSIKEGIADFFDIHSPSRLMYSMGEFVTEGLANGIESLSNYAVSQTERMTSAILGAFEGLEEDIALGDFVAGSMPSVASMTSGLVKLPPSIKQASVSGVETVATKKSSAQNGTGSDSKGDTYIIMDKKLVGEAVADSVDASQKRKASRLAQFNPKVVPTY
ncbi:carbamoyl-phosphate synthase large subunit [Bacillus paranthracis]|uniref:phage tail protein n=1 Tax=Bacillus cereus group TaxID=86661 RepID=UPI001F57599C|nr:MULTISPECIES: carbamoyl-phosphate synthase large subunit [Bacillus cereus group]MCU5020515.1 carbamoyl-phosphate synthase large subunit [Bacillus paranthracis]